MQNHKSYLSITIAALFFVAATAILTNESTVLWPKPSSYFYESEGENLLINPCEVKYIIEAPATQFVEDIINLYLDQVFKCDRRQTLKAIMNIVVKNTQRTVPTSTA
jgi:hypothetical protein